MFAPHACTADLSRGRRFPEPPSRYRTDFQRDRDRIIHSTAFRRLKHKTQVFVEHEGDHYRTRLTHSIEVAQVARTIAGELRLNPDLTESVALAHDLGHPPFGHTGEDALDSCMAAHGGFDHNAQTIKVVTSLERHYPEFDGLNLTWETLEGIAKHNGPVDGPPPVALSAYDRLHDLELRTHAGAEAQVAALADDIAYNSHDLDDGLRAGLFDEVELLELPIAGDLYRSVDRRYPGLDGDRRRHTVLREFFGFLVESAIKESKARLARLAPTDANAIRKHHAPVIAFPEAVRQDLQAISDFLFLRMYRHSQVQSVRDEAATVVRDLFAAFTEDGERMPENWRPAFRSEGARAIADYIAGMTDRFALNEHRRVCGASGAAFRHL